MGGIAQGLLSSIGLGPILTGFPDVTGSATVGATLSTDGGTWANNRTSFAYQWTRNGVNIPGATLSSYTTVTADIGTSVTVVVTAINAYGSTSTPALSSRTIIRPAGQAIYDTPGTYNWVAPANVTSVAVVVIGGGGGGSQYGGQGAGAGGGLAYVNNFTVTPGTSYTVTVGTGGPLQTDGGASWFNSTATVRATGGGGASGATGGTGGKNVAGTGGGTGGIGGSASSGNPAGGGAAGYTGNGGAGGNGISSGANGAGGGAGGSSGSNTVYGTWNGGGTGVSTGQGANGAGGVYNSGLGYGGAGGGGSGGDNGAALAGGVHGRYGAGGGNAGTDQRATGGRGVVRVIWGDFRAFPSTNTGNY